LESLAQGKIGETPNQAAPDHQSGWSLCGNIPASLSLKRCHTFVDDELGPQHESGFGRCQKSTAASMSMRTKTLHLSVAANQVAVVLHEARLLSEQKRVADIDQVIGEHTDPPFHALLPQ